ncbi:MAG: YfhO family protein [Ancalomicrobiaceae bacterium]|nr:YfhO family protein [Ancalomicrobiaceae bacterium]
MSLEAHPRPKSTFPAVAVILILAGLYLAWPWVSGAYTIPWDAKAHFLPQFDFLASSIGAGDSPFWNPYTFAGWPQVSDPQSLIFVPAFLLMALFDHQPSPAALDATVFASLGLGALALAGYFHDRRWHPAGAAVAALSFAFGGAAAWRLQHTGQVMSISMLPVVLFLLHRALDRRSFLWGILAGVTAGFLALGRDQVALLSVYCLVGYAASYLLGRKPLVRIPGSILPLLGGLIGGLAVVTVPVVLTYILAGNSNRPTIDFSGAGIASMHPVSFITLINADLFGMRLHDPKVDFWGPPSAAFGVTLYIARNMADVYAGMIPAYAILMWGLARRQLLNREILYFTAALVVACLYTIGWYTPAFRFFYDHFPGVSLYRRPADATFLVGFLVALIGGWLTHRWLSDEMPKARFGARVWQLIVTALVLVVLPYLFAKHAHRVNEAIRPSIETIVTWVGAIVALHFARFEGQRSKVLATLILAAFTAFDLGYQISGRLPSETDLSTVYNESTAYPPAMFDAMRFDTKDPTIAFLKSHTAADAVGPRRDRVELTGLGFHWPNISMIHRLDNTLGYNPLRIKMYQDATGARDHVAVPEQRNFSAPLFPSYRSLLADMLGLRWIALGAPVETILLCAPHPVQSWSADLGKVMDGVDAMQRPSDLKLVSADKGVWIYENPRALPRVLFVGKAETADFERIIETGNWPAGFNPEKTVLLETASKADAPAAAEADLSHAVAITSYRNTEVVISVDAPAAGYLVLNDVYHRWWDVFVDGKQADLLRANVLFRAVAVPAGKHTVRFAFSPFAGAYSDLRAMIDKRK